MLQNLSNRFSQITKKIKGEPRLTESNTSEMLRDIRMALLEADVAVSVVKDFVDKIRKKALGEKVIESLTPGQTLVGIVKEELANLLGANLGADSFKLSFATQPPAVILVAGLQGVGKTTSVAKLAKFLVSQSKKKVITVSTDIYRPAAIEQLKVLTSYAKIDFFPSNSSENPVDIAIKAVNYAKKYHHEILIIDTAGRIGLDEKMMNEINLIQKAIKPIETLFVVDAMQGQDAINVAGAFNDNLNLTGVILTKLDGDSRGGAAISINHVIGKPIKFAGISEKLDGLEVFEPERMANRILGMGDIIALVDVAKKNINLNTAENLAKKIKSGGKFDLNDFKTQLSQMKKMGDISNLIDKLPSNLQNVVSNSNSGFAESQVIKMEAIINSMTPFERLKPENIKASRKKRIAYGSGANIQEINKMLKQFNQMQGLMKKIKGGGMMKMLRNMKGLFPRI